MSHWPELSSPVDPPGTGATMPSPGSDVKGQWSPASENAPPAAASSG